MYPNSLSSRTTTFPLSSTLSLGKGLLNNFSPMRPKTVFPIKDSSSAKSGWKIVWRIISFAE